MSEYSSFQKKLTIAAYLQREDNRIHHGYDEELLQYIYVMNGDPRVIEISKKMFRGNRNGKLSNDPIRQFKYLFVASTTLTTRYAIRGGMEPQDAYNLSDLFIRTYHRDDFARMTALMDENEANYASIYGGSNDYKKNKLYDRKEGLYTRLGNAILKELQNYDRYLENAETGGSFHKPDIKKYSRTGQLLRSRREFERGLKRLQRDMQYNYSKWQNQAEHEKLEREIESRGEIQPE